MRDIKLIRLCRLPMPSEMVRAIKYYIIEAQTKQPTLFPKAFLEFTKNYDKLFVLKTYDIPCETSGTQSINLYGTEEIDEIITKIAAITNGSKNRIIFTMLCDFLSLRGVFEFEYNIRKKLKKSLKSNQSNLLVRVGKG